MARIKRCSNQLLSTNHGFESTKNKKGWKLYKENTEKAQRVQGGETSPARNKTLDGKYLPAIQDLLPVRSDKLKINRH